MIGTIDFSVGALLFAVWLFSNAYVMWDVWQHSSEQQRVLLGALPRDVAAIVDSQVVAESLREELELFKRWGYATEVEYITIYHVV